MTYYQQKQGDGVSSKGQKNKIFWSLTILVSLFILSVVYLIQINELVAKNFELRIFEKNYQQGQEKNQSLSVSLMQIQSLDNLQAAAKNLNLISIEKPNYLKVIPYFFALSD